MAVTIPSGSRAIWAYVICDFYPPYSLIALKLPAMSVRTAMGIIFAMPSLKMMWRKYYKQFIISRTIGE